MLLFMLILFMLKTHTTPIHLYDSFTKLLQLFGAFVGVAELLPKHISSPYSAFTVAFRLRKGIQLLFLPQVHRC